ncbi:hypothetical protein T492DRAFT_1093435 [Pavlovales sp. CCMP2436]|nr:hypothetical protein T492DRAFT_1093435 [Pavlovales sp. CCMP2436]
MPATISSRAGDMPRMRSFFSLRVRLLRVDATELRIDSPDGRRERLPGSAPPCPRGVCAPGRPTPSVWWAASSALPLLERPAPRRFLPPAVCAECCLRSASSSESLLSRLAPSCPMPSRLRSSPSSDESPSLPSLAECLRAIPSSLIRSSASFASCPNSVDECLLPPPQPAGAASAAAVSASASESRETWIEGFSLNSCWIEDACWIEGACWIDGACTPFGASPTTEPPRAPASSSSSPSSSEGTALLRALAYSSGTCAAPSASAS